MRHVLNGWPSVNRIAVEDELVPGNIVAALSHKPTGGPSRRPFLTAEQAVAVLDAAKVEGPDTELPLHLLLYTGARRAKITGLRAEDVDLRDGKIRNVLHAQRRLKTRNSERVIPLWSELRAVLGPRLVPLDRTPPTGFLFPGRAGYLHDIRKQLDAVAKKAKLPTALVRGRPLRVTYIAHRLQTLDGGALVSFYTVARECGHSTAVCEGIYARLPAAPPPGRGSGLPSGDRFGARNRSPDLLSCCRGR